MMNAGMLQSMFGLMSMFAVAVAASNVMMKLILAVATSSQRNTLVTTSWRTMSMTGSMGVMGMLDTHIRLSNTASRCQVSK
jgi:hypothetical protein